jgi:hypothetical protein
VLDVWDVEPGDRSDPQQSDEARILIDAGWDDDNSSNSSEEIIETTTTAPSPPASGANWTCMMGLSCSLAMNSSMLRGSARLVVLSSGICGNNQSKVIDFKGFMMPAEPGIDGKGFWLRSAKTGHPSDEYRVCWSLNPKDFGLSTNVLYYPHDLGMMRLEGPIADNRTVVCTLGFSCILSLDGLGLISKNLLVVQEGPGGCNRGEDSLLASIPGIINPRNPNTDNTTYAIGSAIEKVGHTSYSICWGHNPNGWKQSNVHIGSLIFRGPIGIDVKCTVYRNCTFTLEGPLIQSGDRLRLIINANSGCGQSWNPVINSGNTKLYDNKGLPTSSIILKPQSLKDGISQIVHAQLQVEVPETTIGSRYMMCWCSYLASNDTKINRKCDRVEDFNVQLGTLSVVRVDPTQTLSCPLSKDCTFQVKGHDLGPGDRLLLIDYETNCHEPKVNTFKNVFPFAETPVYISSGGGIFKLGRPIKVGVFRLCFCPNTTNVHCLPAQNEGYGNFHQSAGKLAIRGSDEFLISSSKCLDEAPYKLCSVTLRPERAGRPFTVRIKGWDLKDTDVLQIHKYVAPKLKTYGTELTPDIAVRGPDSHKFTCGTPATHDEVEITERPRWRLEQKPLNKDGSLGEWINEYTYTLLAWPVHIRTPGLFSVCWGLGQYNTSNLTSSQGGASNLLDVQPAPNQHFVEVERLDMTGPMIDQRLPKLEAGVVGTVKLTGRLLRLSDRLTVVPLKVMCGTPAASESFKGVFTPDRQGDGGQIAVLPFVPILQPSNAARGSWVSKLLLTHLVLIVSVGVVDFSAPMERNSISVLPNSTLLDQNLRCSSQSVQRASLT